MTVPATAPVLRMESITKRFAGVTALDGVDLALGRGEVHALVGENGAGKSTLVKIMTGAYRCDGGRIWLEGRPVTFDTPAAAQAAGVIAVHQEIHLLRHRTVAENVFLGREPRRWGGFVDWGRMYADAGALLRELGLDIPPDATLGALRTAQQQMVAIARGVSLGAKVLVLDEPTSSLAEREVGILYRLIAKLKAQGTAVVYISHRFDELYAVCDRVTVLRDGRLVDTRPLAGLERLDLVCLMLGKSREELAAGATEFTAHPSLRSGQAAADEAPLLRAESLRRGHKLRGVSLEVRRGEVVGLAGLLGSGRTETARAIFGADPAEAGELAVRGERFAPKSPNDAIGARIAFVSEDRKAEGIIPELSVRENLTLAALPTLTRMGVVDRARQGAIVDEYVRRFGIKMATPEQKIRELSGGNQQKVLLARWLCTRPDLFLVDEPTRGIDIGARGEIQALVNELASSGLGVLMISSDLEELVEGSSRVVVLRDGADVAELHRGQISQDAIIRAMAGGSAAAGPPAAGDAAHPGNAPSA
ncbi:MAG TPA: sugar ABC transporter ATP-binding protein [Gemmatimonadaceae bacterium]|nr:sugar ABC transporter ATP-binding protein [Gemmatimonadaceae bacterium]